MLTKKRWFISLLLATVLLFSCVLFVSGAGAENDVDEEQLDVVAEEVVEEPVDEVATGWPAGLLLPYPFPVTAAEEVSYLAMIPYPGMPVVVEEPVVDEEAIEDGEAIEGEEPAAVVAQDSPYPANADAASGMLLPYPGFTGAPAAADPEPEVEVEVEVEAVE